MIAGKLGWRAYQNKDSLKFIGGAVQKGAVLVQFAVFSRTSDVTQ